MMRPPHPLIQELLDDIDRGRVCPLTSVKNIESVLKEFVDEYSTYEALLEDLAQWNYIKQDTGIVCK